MAIDTEQKRRSIADMRCPWRRQITVPSGSIDQGAKQSALGYYSGILFVAPSLSGTYHSFVSSGGYLQEIVEGVETSRVHETTGKTQILKQLQTDEGRVLNKVRITSADSPYTDLESNDIIIAYANAAITINLLAGADGVRKIIKNTGTFNVTVSPNGSETIEDATIAASQRRQYIYDDDEGWIRI